MALITSQQLANYYELYSGIDVTFTKEVIQVIGLRSKETFLRCLGTQWPCIIYSSSMTEAKVIANINNDLSEKIRDANDLVSLRFAFEQSDKQAPLAFFISAKVVSYDEYAAERPELSFITLKYTQRPSDDLIASLGNLLEANINSQRRKEERIDINPESIRKLGLESKNATLMVDEVPRNCIVRDISFSGAMVLVTGVAKFLLEKDAKLKLALEDRQSPIVLKGKISRFDEYPDQKSIGSVGLNFYEDEVPMAFKMKINDYLTTSRKHS